MVLEKEESLLLISEKVFGPSSSVPRPETKIPP